MPLGPAPTSITRISSRTPQPGRAACRRRRTRAASVEYEIVVAADLIHVDGHQGLTAARRLRIRRSRSCCLPTSNGEAEMLIEDSGRRPPRRVDRIALIAPTLSEKSPSFQTSSQMLTRCARRRAPSSSTPRPARSSGLRRRRRRSAAATCGSGPRPAARSSIAELKSGGRRPHSARADRPAPAVRQRAHARERRRSPRPGSRNRS